jgi:hypothetical protein
MTESDILLGIIIDLSASMKKSWRNEDGEKMPKIEIIRDSLNDYFKRLHQVYHIEKNVSIFCLGFGIQLPESYRYVKFENDEELIDKEKKEETRVADVICDLIALSELVPTEKDLQYIKDTLNNIWKGYAEKLLDDIKLDHKIFTKLKSYIGNTLLLKGKKNFRYKLYLLTIKDKKNPFENIIIKIIPNTLGNIGNREEYLKKIANLESNRYTKDIENHANKIFKTHRKKYEDLIRGKLNEFACEQISFILKKQALGFSTKELLTYFDFNKAEQIATEIYKELNKDVKKQIALAWEKNRWSLIWKSYINLGAKLDYKHVKDLTKKSIEYKGWSVLKPFVENMVFGIFQETFENEAEKMLPRWISYASKQEITLPLKKVLKLLPETSQKNIYSNKFMFGTTPMSQTIERAALRLLREEYSEKDKYLLVISDGKFDNSLETIRLTSMLKTKNIKIVCGQVSPQNYITKLVHKISSNWDEGTKNLFHMSSDIESDEALLESMKKKNLIFNKNSKLLYQINESKHLRKILNSILFPQKE